MKKIFLLLLLLLPICVHAEQFTNVKRLNRGYTLDINGVAYRALSMKDFKTLENLSAQDQQDKQKLVARVKELMSELKKSKANAAKYQEALKAQTDLNTQYRQLNNSYSELNAKYSKTAGKLVELNKNYSTTLNQFDALVEKYRKVAVRANPRNKLDLGLGVLKPTASGADPHYFAMVGSGVTLLNTEVRGWLLLGNNSYGAMVGVSF